MLHFDFWSYVFLVIVLSAMFTFAFFLLRKKK